MSEGNIYCYQLYVYCISLAFPCYNQNHNQLFRHLIFAFKVCLIRFFYFHVGAKPPAKCFIRGARYVMGDFFGFGKIQDGGTFF